MLKPLITIRQSVDRHELVTNTGRRVDLSRYFTIGRDVQGVRADRAGEYQRTVVNPVKDVLFG